MRPPGERQEMGLGHGTGGVLSLVMGSLGLWCTPPSGFPLGVLHKHAVSPLFTMENMKHCHPLTPFFSYVFSGSSTSLWLVSSFTAYSSFVGMFRTIPLLTASGLSQRCRAESKDNQ